MTQKQYLRRIAILCLHCLRNLAYYRAGWSKGSLILRSNFWVAVNGNFIDICVLEWCKLFGDSKSKHFWKKGISDSEVFLSGLLNKLEMNEEEFDNYITKMRTYRDKYIAHWDLDEKVTVPRLDITKKSALYLYTYLLDHEDKGGYFDDGPRNASQFYDVVLKEGTAIFETLTSK